MAMRFCTSTDTSYATESAPVEDSQSAIETESQDTYEQTEPPVVEDLSISQEYRTVEGDTWDSIAERYGISVQSLQNLNPAMKFYLFQPMHNLNPLTKMLQKLLL